jgi:hypothetical protein
MSTAGIAIDPWKLDIFERRLKDAGYTWTKVVDTNLIVLKVTTENMDALAEVIKACVAECTLTGKPQP